MPPPTQTELQEVMKRLLEQQRATESEVTKFASAMGISSVAGAKTVVKNIMDEARKQLNEYQDNIVDRFGDISTQMETFGKSAAKLEVQNTALIRQQFLQLEVGAVKMRDVFEDAATAAEHAGNIIGHFQGSARQFMEDLQGGNLQLIQMLSKATGYTEEQTASIMKLSKARGEDSKQLLADIGMMSKAVADKFGFDVKAVTANVHELMTETETFGKVSVDVAVSAAAKFQSLGVKVSDVSKTIGSTYQSFDSASTAAAKMSQVFGVNVDAMQMMIDVNSGPDGMVRAMDNLRESLIGAGVDISELSPPLRRLISDMTGISDQKTIESLFDPERIGEDTDAIIAATEEAAQAQKTPAEAVQVLEKDIRHINRSIEDMYQLINDQQLFRLGTQFSSVSKDVSDTTSAFGAAFDAVNKFAEGAQPAIDALEKIKGTSRGVREQTVGVGEVLTQEMRNASVRERNTPLFSEDAGQRADFAFSDMYQRFDRGVVSSPEMMRVTGFQIPPDMQKLFDEQKRMADLFTAAFANVPAGNAAAQKAADDAMTQLKAELQKVLPGSGSNPFSQPGTPPAGTTPPLATVPGAPAPTVIQGGTPPIVPPAAPAPATASPAAVTPPVVSPAAVAAPPVAVPIVPQVTAAAPAPGTVTATTSAISTPGGGVGTATAVATGNQPINLTLTVNVDGNQLRGALIGPTNQFAIVPSGGA